MNNTPAIILVHPQMGENIGAAARAMMNFGLRDLRLVAPRDGWPNQRAVDMSSGALDVMPPVQVYDTLAEALTGCTYVYATSARRRELNKPICTLKEAAISSLKHERSAFVFGPERTGLDNDDLALCHEMITVPTNPDFSSINLGQAVLLVTYEWFQNREEHGFQEPLERAPHEKLEEMFTRLEAELEAGHFFREEGLRPTMARNIRTMLMRAEFSAQEVSTFQGMISALIGNKTRKRT